MYHVPSMHVVYMAVRIQFVALECYEYFILFYFILFLINMESRAVRCIEQETYLGDKILPRKHERKRLLGGH